MRSFHLALLEAERPLYIGECESLIIPMSDGQYGILAGHINMVGAVKPGKLTFRAPGEEDRVVSVAEGIAKVEKDDVLILLDSAEYLEEIDVHRAEKDAEEARRKLHARSSWLEYEAARIDLARAINRLHVHGSEDK